MRKTGSSYFDKIFHITGGGRVRTPVLLAGFSESIGSAAFETVSPIGGIRPRPDGEILMSLRSTSINDTVLGTGARVVRVAALNIEGERFSELVEMNGTSLVAMVKPAFRINDASVVAHGSSPANEGDITVEADVPSLATVYELIPVAFSGSSPTPLGGSLSAAFTVPKDVVVDVSRGSFSSGDQQGLFTVEFIADIPEIGRRSLAFSVSTDNSVEIGICFPQLTDIELRAKTSTGTAAITVTMRINPVYKVGGRCP